MNNHIKPGMTLQIKKGYYIRAFMQQQPDSGVFYDVQTISTKSLIVLASVEAPFKYVNFKRVSDEITHRASLADPHHSIWACLADGKQIWVTNLEKMVDVLDPVG